MNRPEAKTAPMAASISDWMARYWARRSKNGIILPVLCLALLIEREHTLQAFCERHGRHPADRAPELARIGIVVADVDCLLLRRERHRLVARRGAELDQQLRDLEQRAWQAAAQVVNLPV